MIDDERGVGRSFGGERGEVVDEVATNQARWVAARHSYRRGQAILPVGLTRPDQATQPCDVRVVGDVEGIQVAQRAGSLVWVRRASMICLTSMARSRTVDRKTV